MVLPPPVGITVPMGGGKIVIEAAGLIDQTESWFNITPEPFNNRLRIRTMSNQLYDTCLLCLFTLTWVFSQEILFGDDAPPRTGGPVFHNLIFGRRINLLVPRLGRGPGRARNIKGPDAMQ